jgi:co-chaperonin GroES (HSP10)
MSTLSIKQMFSVVGLAVIALTVLTPDRATAESRPQEVRRLISAHEALAMKIRPLKDRVIIARSTNVESNTGNASRVPETLRHKNRAAAKSDDYGRIKVKLSALEKSASKERERISRPEFGVAKGDGRRGSRSSSGNIDAKAIASARKKLADLQHQLAALERELGRR